MGKKYGNADLLRLSRIHSGKGIYWSFEALSPTQVGAEGSKQQMIEALAQCSNKISMGQKSLARSLAELALPEKRIQMVYAHILQVAIANFYVSHGR